MLSLGLEEPKKRERLLAERVTLRKFYNLSERRRDSIYETSDLAVTKCNSMRNAPHVFLALTSP